MYTVAFYFTGELFLLQALYLIDPYRLTEEYENVYRKDGGIPGFNIEANGVTLYN
jgi:hypothetical protein